MDEITLDDRQAFRQTFTACWLCGGEAHDVHEIARGVHRGKAVRERCCWIRTCRHCHASQLGDYSLWPLERQVALKMIHDPEHYDRKRINEIRGRAEDAISEQDVAYQVATLWRMR